jgi:hypothetical protein
MGGFDVKEAQFISPRRIIGPCRLYRVASVHQIDEIHPFDHAALRHI